MKRKVLSLEVDPRLREARQQRGCLMAAEVPLSEDPGPRSKTREGASQRPWGPGHASQDRLRLVFPPDQETKGSGQQAGLRWGSGVPGGGSVT